MTVYRTTSSKAVLARVWRTFKPTEPGWKFDAVAWIGEGLEMIGHFSGTYRKSSPVKGETGAIVTKNHRAKLPCDLESIFGVEYNGYRLPYGGDITLPGLVCDERTTAIEPQNVDHNEELLMGTSKVNISPLPAQSIPTNDYYQINPDYIITSFESGHVRLHYNAFYTDKDGLPLIPDRSEFVVALSWYIMMNMLLGGYKHPVVNFQEAQRQWDHYATLAANYAAYPSIDKMDLFRRMWTRMIPEDNFPDDFFMGAEQSQDISLI